MNKKLIITGIVVAATALLFSVMLNLYFFGWKRIERKIYLRGVNDAVVSIFNQAQQTGELTINTTSGQLTLVVKVPENTKKTEGE